jgi:ureidoacrylate peracid hydrolase
MSSYVTENTLEKKAKSWLKKIQPFNQERMALKPGKAALMVIDMQNFFLKEDGPALIESAFAFLPLLKELITSFREAGRPVIFTKHVHHPERLDAGIMEWWWADMCLEGSPESEVYQVIAPRPNEKVVQKHRYSAFYNTDLETVLRCLKIEDLVISGVMTNMCCESTARDAYYRDYRVFFLADGTATISEEMHIASLLNLAYGFARVTTIRDILQQFQKQRKGKQ